MVKIKALLIAYLLIIASSTLPVGGGVFLYRYNRNKEVEFLFAFDPKQHHENRKGFEYPVGGIKSGNIDGNIDYKDPYTFLKGSVRELLEELVFVPAIIWQNMTKALPKNNHPYDQTTKEISGDYEKEAIPKIAQYIENNNGLFFIYKCNIFEKQHAPLSHKTAIFFWDITNFTDPSDPKNPQSHVANLPKILVQKRADLKKEGFKLNDIDAEPCAFAWVKGNDLLRHLNSPDDQVWISPTYYAQDSNAKTESVYKNNKILISTACMGMMRDREKDRFNEQENSMCVKSSDGSFKIFDQTGIYKFFSKTMPPRFISSSMSAIINTLQNPDNYRYFTSKAQEAAPKQKQAKEKTTSTKATQMLINALELALILK